MQDVSVAHSLTTLIAAMERDVRVGPREDHAGQVPVGPPRRVFELGYSEGSESHSRTGVAEGCLVGGIG